MSGQAHSPKERERLSKSREAANVLEALGYERQPDLRGGMVVYRRVVVQEALITKDGEVLGDA